MFDLASCCSYAEVYVRCNNRILSIEMTNHLTLLALFALLALITTACRQPLPDPCATIRCQAGYYCNKGECIKQKFHPKKHLCPSLDMDPDVKALRCEAKHRPQICPQVVGPISCGYNNKGIKQEFSNDCMACANPEVLVYYPLPCEEAPSVCGESEECINGGCTTMFDDPSHINSRFCNQKKDC